MSKRELSGEVGRGAWGWRGGATQWSDGVKDMALQFLMIIRYFAKKFNVRAGDIERTLFLAHRKYQEGRLYSTGREIVAWGDLDDDEISRPFKLKKNKRSQSR